MAGAVMRWISGLSSRRLAVILVVIAVEVALIVPNVSFSGASLKELSWPMLVGAAVAELLSIAAFARMRRRLLRVGGTRVGLRRMGVLTLASNAVSATAPAGTAVSTAYMYQQLRRIGANSSVVVWTLAASSVVSGLAFTIITVAGTILDGDLSFRSVVEAAGVSALISVALVSGLAYVTTHPAPIVAVIGRLAPHLPARWVGVDGHRLTDGTRRSLDQLADISPRTGDWAVVLILAVLNWSGDLACFVLCCHAVGANGLALGAAAIAYVAGLATISITLTPGGLGTVEAGMLLGLANAGVAAPVALAGIIAYRVVAYLLVGGVGWVAWLWLRRGWTPARQEQDAFSAGLESLLNPGVGDIGDAPGAVATA